MSRGAEANEQALRNQNPHKPARVAMILWSRDYASQVGGSMDFWDKLTEVQKDICRELVERITNAPEERP